MSENAPWLLILSAIALLPFHNLANAPMAIMAVIGGIILVQKGLRCGGSRLSAFGSRLSAQADADPAGGLGRGSRQRPAEGVPNRDSSAIGGPQSPPVLFDPRLRLMFGLFLCIWLPMAISLVDAANLERSATTVLAFLRFPLAGVFIISVLGGPGGAVARRRLAAGTAIVIGIWCIDGVIQWLAGRNVFGYPYDRHNLTGMFHPKRLIGIVTATLAAVYFEGVRRLVMRRAFGAASGLGWLLIVPLVLVIALGGSRTSWMMLALATVLWGGYRYLTSTWPGRHKAAIAAALLAVAAVPVIANLPGMERRVEQTKHLFSGDIEQIDAATSLRLPVWDIAWRMGRDHWLTGVGPRGYRYLYVKYADEDTPWVSPDGLTGAAYPHLTVLEVFSETGIIGLAGYGLFAILLFRSAWQGATDATAPWLISAIVALFPLNMHMALYSTFWAHVSWWALLVAVGTMTTAARSDTGRVVP